MDVVATVAAAIDWPTVLAYIFTVMAAYVALTVAAVASPLARRILFKSRLYARGIAHMALSREKKGWPKARGNGVPVGDVVTKRIIFVHVMKNIMIPVVTVMGLEFGSLIGFSVVTETIFAWPGMGKLLINAILQLDRPVVVAYLMVMVLFFVVINLLVDILYSILDPRVRLQDQNK